MIRTYFSMLIAEGFPDAEGKMKQFASWFTHGVPGGPRCENRSTNQRARRKFSRRSKSSSRRGFVSRQARACPIRRDQRFQHPLRTKVPPRSLLNCHSERQGGIRYLPAMPNARARAHQGQARGVGSALDIANHQPARLLHSIYPQGLASSCVKHGHPFFGQGGCVVALPARDRLHRVEGSGDMTHARSMCAVVGMRSEM